MLQRYYKSHTEQNFYTLLFSPLKFNTQLPSTIVLQIYVKCENTRTPKDNPNSGERMGTNGGNKQAGQGDSVYVGRGSLFTSEVVCSIPSWRYGADRYMWYGAYRFGGEYDVWGEDGCSCSMRFAVFLFGGHFFGLFRKKSYLCIV